VTVSVELFAASFISWCPMRRSHLNTPCNLSSSVPAVMCCCLALPETPRCLQIKPLTRFLCDASLSGGSWLWACSTPTQQQQQQALYSAGSSSSSSEALFQVVPPGSSHRRSSCDVEVCCSWRCLHSLTPDATQLAEPDWRPQVPAASYTT
jgi:hypothetical protein